jgi:hypothetical protein
LLAADTSKLSIRELLAAVDALVVNGRSAAVPWAAVDAALEGLHSCSDFAELDRPTTLDTACDLGATVAAKDLAALKTAKGSH